MESEDDIERSAAFDEQLRDHKTPEDVDENASVELTSRRMQTIRLLHEVFRAAPAQTIVEPTDSPLPERIGRFRIQRLLGRGGFGTVYLADDPLLNRLVALKVIHSHLLRDPTIRKLALREREAMARLQHPNIIPVWEAAEDDDDLFIVSEYCPGQTLAERLHDHPGPIAPAIAAHWLYCLADAVAHSHQRGVIHRDLKPSNILLEPVTHLASVGGEPSGDVEPRLSDFGLAKILDSAPANPATIPTQYGLFVGSLEYASPEQVRGHVEAIGPATDVYALGVLLFQLLTGRLPHQADSQYELARHICEEDAFIPHECAVLVPKDLQAIALRAMARQVTDRYSTAAAIRDDLGRYLRGQPVDARPVSALEQLLRLARKRPAVTLLGAACCGLTLLVLYNLIVNNRQLSSQSRELQTALQLANEQRAEAEHQRQRAESGQALLSKLRYRESIKLAFDQLDQQNYIGLQDTLRRLDSDYGSTIDGSTMELRHLRKQLDSAYLSFDLQGDPVHSLAWHPQRQELLSISASGRLRHWNPNRPQPLSEHQTAVGAHALAIHPDGKTIALPEYSGKKSTITLWDDEGLSQKDARFPTHSRTVESLEYSPDGRWFAAGPRYANVIVTELETGESFAHKSDRRNRQVVFSPESDRVAVHAAPGQVDIVDLNSRSTIATIESRYKDVLNTISSITWLASHDALLINSRSMRLQMYSARDGQKLADVFAGCNSENIAVSPDGRRVVLGDNMGCAKLFDSQALTSGTDDKVALSPNMRVLHGKINDIAFIDNERFIAADDEGNMMRWSQPAEQPRMEISDSISYHHWIDNESLLAYASHGQSIHCLQLNGNQLQPKHELPKHVDREVARIESKNRRALVDFDGKITFINKQNGKEISTCQLPRGKAIPGNEMVCDKLLLSQDDKLLFATGNCNQVHAVNIDDGQILWTRDMTNRGRCLAEDAARHQLYFGGGFEALTLLNISSGEILSENPAGNGTFALFVNQHQNRLITGHKDGTVRQRELGEDKSSIHRVSTYCVNAVTLTPDGRTLITGDDAGVLRLADSEVVPYGVLYQSKLVQAVVISLKWSPDGKRLAALINSSETPVSEIVVFEAGPAR